MRNRLLALGSMAAALAAAYAVVFYYKHLPAPLPPPQSAARGVKLASPAAMVASPLGPGKPDAAFTNDMQARFLQDQAAKLGISRFAKASNLAGEQSREVAAPIGYDEGLERVRAMSRALSTQRRAVDRGRYDTVPLAGETPQIITSPQGAPPGGAPS